MEQMLCRVNRQDVEVPEGEQRDEDRGGEGRGYHASEEEKVTSQVKSQMEWPHRRLLQVGN